jgi:uncharacterized membrane protein
VAALEGLGQKEKAKTYQNKVMVNPRVYPGAHQGPNESNLILMDIIEVHPQRAQSFSYEGTEHLHCVTAHPVGEPFIVPVQQQSELPQATAVATAVVHATAIPHSPGLPTRRQILDRYSADQSYYGQYSPEHYISPHRADLIQIFRVARAIRLVAIIDVLFLAINSVRYPYLMACAILPLCGYQSGKSYNKYLASIYILYEFLDIAVQASFMYSKQSWILFNLLDILVDISIIWILVYFIKALSRTSAEDIQGLQRANRGSPIQLV